MLKYKIQIKIICAKFTWVRIVHVSYHCPSKVVVLCLHL